MLHADELVRELDAWRAAGRRVGVWWRDDDATGGSGALDRLVGLARRHRVSVALAVIPESADRSLGGVGDEPRAWILQHGFRHRNHAGAGGRAVECGGARDTDAVLAELADGRARLSALFGSRFLPVMVPPWNRIETRVLERLPAAGYRGVSVFGPRAKRGDGFVEANTHLDLLRWRDGGPRFAGHDKLLAETVEEVRRLREGGSPQDEPFGLLTHHLVHDAETWRFLEALLPLLAGHPAVRWLDAPAVFGLAPAGRAEAPAP